MQKYTHAKTLIIFFSLMLLGPLAIDLFLPSFPVMMKYFKVSESEIHLTISVYMIFLGLGQLFIGNYSDKKGRQASALLGIIFFIIGSITGGISENFYTLLLGRALQGIGTASCSVSSIAWIRENYNQKESVKWLSYMMGAVGSVPAFAPSIGSVIANHWGWGATFGFKALLGILLFFGVYLFVPKVATNQTAINNVASKQNCNFKSILSNNLFRRYNFVSVVGMGAILTYISNAPIVALDYGNFSNYEFSISFGIVGLVQITSNLLSSHISLKIGQVNTIVLGTIIILLSGLNLVYISNSSTILFFLFSGLSLFGVSLIIGPSMGLTLADFRMCAGKASSVDGFLRMTGGAIISATISTFGNNAIKSRSIAFLIIVFPKLFILIDVYKKNKEIDIKA